MSGSGIVSEYTPYSIFSSASVAVSCANTGLLTSPRSVTTSGRCTPTFVSTSARRASEPAPKTIRPGCWISVIMICTPESERTAVCRHARAHGRARQVAQWRVVVDRQHGRDRCRMSVLETLRGHARRGQRLVFGRQAAAGDDDVLADLRHQRE